MKVKQKQNKTKKQNKTNKKLLRSKYFKMLKDENQRENDHFIFLPREAQLIFRQLQRVKKMICCNVKICSTTKNLDKPPYHIIVRLKTSFELSKLAYIGNVMTFFKFGS